MTSSPAGAAPATAPEQTHPCVRCGRPVPLDVAMCERCNPLGLSQPAATQVHGTVAVALLVAVVVLAVFARATLSGVGPFRASIEAVEPEASGLTITLNVSNEGSRAGSTTCQLTVAARRGTGGSAVVVTPQIEPGTSRSFSRSIDEFGSEPVELAIACQDP